MSFEYIGIDEAIARDGLRMVVVGGVPSPWGEAAKGILHVKRIEWRAVRLAYDSEPLKRWAGQRTGPVAIYDDEPPRAAWDDILLLAERLAPTPPLLPADPAQRALVLDIGRELCGEGGLGWWRRLQLVHAGSNGSSGGGFPEPVAKYLGKKYGYSADAGAAAGSHVVEKLGRLAARLATQRSAGSPYLVGDSLTAADIYSAAFVAMFRPLADPHCAMERSTRAAFESCDDATLAALDPMLLEHREMMYREHLELPLSL
jgi:glutathione S-transferase